MLDIKIRLIDMLGLITLVVLAGLIADYLGALKKKARLGLSVAVIGICAGFGLTLGAVLPGNHFYGTVFSHGAANQKAVALTFDDGPYPPYTDKVLDILKERQIKATFFIIGQNAARHPETVKRIFREGHQLGNHTYTHQDLLKADPAAVADEIDRTGELIYGLTGSWPHVIRPPHGFRDAVVLSVIAERSLKAVDWSVAGRDWTNPGAAVIAERILGSVKNGSIILLHDGDATAAAAPREQTAKATEKIIDELLAQGYSFVTVDEILEKTQAVGCFLKLPQRLLTALFVPYFVKIS